MEIENFRRQNPGQTIIAYFDVVIPSLSLTLRNWKVLRTKSNSWIAVPPSYKKAEDDFGKPIYGPYFEFGPKRRDEFMKRLREELKDYVKDCYE